MSTSKRRKGKQKVSFARSEAPPPGEGGVVAFPGQGPRSIRPSDPDAAPAVGADRTSQGPRGSLLPEPVPESAQRNSILEAEMADLVGERTAEAAPAPAASASTAPAAPRPAAVPLVEGSVDDEDTQIGAAPAAVTRPSASPAPMGAPGRHALEYEDDVTAVDAAPLGSEPPPAGGIVPRPEARWSDDEATRTDDAATAAPATAPDPEAGRRVGEAARADADDDAGHEPHEQAFFDSVPPPEAHHEGFDDLATVKDELPVGDRKARNWTFGLLAVGVVVIGGFLAYQGAVVPDEAELGAAPEPTLPDPSLLADEQTEPAEDAAGEGAAAADDTAAADAPEAEAAAGDEEAPVDEEALADELEEALADAAVEPSTSPEELAALVALPPEVEVPPGDYDALVEQGRAAEQGNDFGEAEKLFRAALMSEPQGGDALANLSFILLNQGENEDARSVAEWAVALAPKNSTGWISLGAARQALGDYPGARDAYRTCVDQAEGKYVLECRRMLR